MTLMNSQTRTTLYMTKKLKKKVRKQAFKRGISISEFIRFCLKKELEKKTTP